MQVQYHRRCGPSGRRLTRALRDLDTPFVLNWGSSEPTDSRVINNPEAVRHASRKADALAVFEEQGVPCPKVVPSPKAAAVAVGMFDTPVIARTRNHRAGSGLWVCRSPEDVVRACREGADHFMDFIEGVDKEYRVHVFDGKVIKSSEKTGGTGVIRTRSHGWRFINCSLEYENRKPVRVAARAAIKALGLDFGAADILVDASGKVYVTEVNTAPSITDPAASTFDRYVEHINAFVAERG